MKRPTIADIAQQAGVSKGAVSYALNGQPGVSAQTRERILAIAREVGWSPNSAARALSAAHAGAVGLAVSRPASVLAIEPFFMQLISGIESVLSAHGIALMLQLVPDHTAETAVHRRWWAERRVDGVILTDLYTDDRRIEALVDLGMPAVVIGGPTDEARVVEVWTDDGAAMEQIIGYLAALGHRSVGHVSGPANLRHTSLRARAVQAAARRLGLDPPPTVEADYTGERAARATRELLSLPAPPTAIVYDNDVMAVAGVSVTREMGVAVPDSVSLVAFEDSPLCELVHPSLTALHRDIVAYGSQTARCLLAVLEGAPVGQHQSATPHLIPRGTTARPRRRDAVA